MINYFNFNIKTNDFISFNKKIKTSIYKILLKNIKGKRFFAQPPYYLEINYRTLKVLIISKFIDIKFIPYPFFFKKTGLIKGLHTSLWGW